MILAVTSWSPNAFAASCRTAALHVAWEKKAPLHILNAIAKVESNFNPYAFNVEGTPYRFKTKREALNFLNQMIREKRSADVGCMQMNIRWHLHRFAKPEDMLDPLTNMRAAHQYLEELYGSYGTWEAAAGAYHNMRDPLSNRRYRCLLANELSPGASFPYCSQYIATSLPMN